MNLNIQKYIVRKIMKHILHICILLAAIRSYAGNSQSNSYTPVDDKLIILPSIVTQKEIWHFIIINHLIQINKFYYFN